MLHRISKKTAGKGIILMNIVTIVYYLLVIIKILPYNSISGGGLASYQAAAIVSITSIIGMLAGITLIAIATGLKGKAFFKVWFWIMFVSLCIDIISNLAGVTIFEKVVMTIVCGVQAILFFRLATDVPHKISKKAAGIGIIATYIYVISIYFLAIFKIIPYSEISGQALESHQIVVIMSIVNILVTSIGIPVIAIAAGLKSFAHFKVWFWLMFAFLCFNTLLNLASVTLSEKIVMGLVTVIEAILYFRLATEKK